MSGIKTAMTKRSFLALFSAKIPLFFCIFLQRYRSFRSKSSLSGQFKFLCGVTKKVRQCCSKRNSFLSQSILYFCYKKLLQCGNDEEHQRKQNLKIKFPMRTEKHAFFSEFLKPDPNPFRDMQTSIFQLQKKQLLFSKIEPANIKWSHTWNIANENVTWLRQLTIGSLIIWFDGKVNTVT